MHFIGIILIGFVAGIIARFLAPGANNPSGFILTTLLGIAGAFVATFIGQAIGHYQPDEGAGLIGAVIGLHAGRIEKDKAHAGGPLGSLPSGPSKVIKSPR